jgi:hypothetical protein
MKQPSEPERLSEQVAELKQALAALSDAEAPSSDALRRMRQRLTVVFESPAPRHGALLRLARGPFGRVVAGIVVLAGAIGVLRVGQPQAAVVDTPLLHPQGDVIAPVSAVQTAPVEPPVSSSSQTPQSAQRSSARAHRGHAHLRTAAPAPVHTTPAVLVPAAESGETTAPLPTAAAVTAQASTPAVHAVPTQAPATTAPAPALDEAALLQRARQLASSDPDAALRLLDEHKRRFAHGMLSPEREVFAIELLRSLSRSDEAAQRLQAFRRSYPGSVYLNRLEH